MRRQKRKRLKSYKLFRRIKETKDAEGNRMVQYSEPTEIKAIIYPASDNNQMLMYGERIDTILNMDYAGNVKISRGDALCIENDSNPDYRVKSIKNYDIKIIELERM